MNRLEELKQQVGLLPMSPGIYQFLDKTGRVIYVGKAKNLRRRVSSYFMESKDHAPKVRLMIRHIDALRHVVVNTETDALLLENALIKELQPQYNILLKDDKSYPWIVVRKEPFPRVQSSRRLLKDGSSWFGPYGSVTQQRVLLEFVREVVQLRTCTLDLSEKAIEKGRYKVCLQYHMGNCKAPCVGLQTARDYAESIALVSSILRGDLRPVRTHLTDAMKAAARDLNFEQAGRLKARLAVLDGYSARSVIVSARIEDVDVFSLLEGDGEAFCNFLRIRHGSVVGVYTVRLQTGIDLGDPSEMLTLAIQHALDTGVAEGGLAAEVIVPFEPLPVFGDGVRFVVPQRGEKHDLLEFSLKSARIYRAEQLKNMEIRDPARHTDRLMAAMQKELHLAKEPRHIECFDNSNLQGTHPVASCVVFRDGRPSTKEYRHFNIKTVVGADDFASMREIVYRRYSRMLHEGTELPDLVIVDGGKGQLSSAYAVLEGLGIADRLPIVGLAKRIEEVFFPNDPEPYYLSRTGEPLRVVRHIRDEAHRFGITFHRQKRDKAFIHSELEDIPGIGAGSIAALLKRFRSVAAVRVASPAELAEVVGAARAEKIRTYFSSCEPEL